MCPCGSSLPPMVRRHISDDIKELALSMSLQRLTHSEVRELTGVSERSLKRLRSTYRRTNAVSATPVAPGRPRVLTSMEVKVRHTYISEMPIYSHSTIYCSSFVIVSTVNPTCLSWSYKQSSVKAAQLRRHFRRLHGPSDGKAIP